MLVVNKFEYRYPVINLKAKTVK